MKETAIIATAQELAEYLFKNKDTFPTVEFSVEPDKWNYAIEVINFVDARMVIGNYFGGGCPFCHDLEDDEDPSELARDLAEWFSKIGCDDEVYL